MTKSLAGTYRSQTVENSAEASSKKRKSLAISEERKKIGNDCLNHRTLPEIPPFTLECIVGASKPYRNIYNIQSGWGLKAPGVLNERRACHFQVRKRPQSFEFALIPGLLRSLQRSQQK